MSKLQFVTIDDSEIEVEHRDGFTVGSILHHVSGKWMFVPSHDDISLSGKHMAEIGKYMLRLANLPKTDDNGPVVTGTLKAKKPHTMTPGPVAQEQRTIAFPNFDPIRQATVAFPEPDPVGAPVTLTYDVQQRGTVTHHATAASSRMVMPGTASIRFVIEGRDYTLDITGVIVGENASVEVRQENEAWSL